jgi:deoxyadenosine/deoxycytidine kinase
MYQKMHLVLPALLQRQTVKVLKTLMLILVLDSLKHQLLKKLESVTFNSPHIILYEPVDEWLNVKPTGETSSLFEKYYGNKEKYGFMFQMFALQTRLQHLSQVLKQHPDTIIICERTHLTDAEIFAKMLERDKIIDSYEYYVYKAWFDYAAATLHGAIKGAIYLRAEPPTCMERIAMRNRSGEDAISVHYIRTLHSLHDEWLSAENPNNTLPTHIVNGNVHEKDIDIQGIIEFVNKVSDARD